MRKRATCESDCDVKAVCDGVAVGVGFGCHARKRVICERNCIHRRAIQFDACESVEGIVGVLGVVPLG